MKTWYLYVLYDPTFLSKRFYVGYSNNPRQRLNEHVSKKESNPRKNNWIDKMLRRGVRPTYHIVKAFPTEELVGEAEIQLIAFCRTIEIRLTNILAGGIGDFARKSGEEQTQAKLSWVKVEEIRRKYFNEKISRQQLAKEYNVSVGLIRKVTHYENWVNKQTVIPDNLTELLKIRAQEGRDKAYNH